MMIPESLSFRVSGHVPLRRLKIEEEDLREWISVFIPKLVSSVHEGRNHLFDNLITYSSDKDFISGEWMDGGSGLGPKVQMSRCPDVV